MDTEGRIALAGLAIFAVWVFGFLPFWFDPRVKMAWNVQTISTLAATASAFFAMLSALVNVYSSRTYRRQLRNITIDSCVGAVIGLQNEINRTLKLSHNKNVLRLQIEEAEIWAAYTAAWSKWVVFAQAFEVARRYADLRQQLQVPDNAANLLGELEGRLRSGDWQADEMKAFQDRVIAMVSPLLAALRMSAV